MKQILLLLLLIVLLGSCKVATVTRIIVVRHAERTAADDLTPAGNQRAAELVRVLGDAGIDSVFSTDFVRTTKTAEPLSTSLGTSTILYDDNSSLLDRILRFSKGKTLFVVGHSDSVPDLISTCGCTPPFSQIPGNQFDNLFIILLQSEKINGQTNRSCKLIRLRYGVPTP